MLLLVLIAVAQLAVLVMILSLVAGETSQHETEQHLAGDRIRSIQRQTIDAMFAASDSDIIDQAGHRAYPEQ